MMKNKIIFFIAILSINISCSSEDIEKSDYQFSLGFEEYTKNNLTVSESHLLKSIEYNKKNNKSYLLLAKIYFFLENEKSFFSLCEKNETFKANYLEINRIKAQWYIKKGKPDEALKILISLCNEYPNDLISIYLLANIYYVKKDIPNALYYYHKSLGYYAYLKNIHKNIADIYRENNMLERVEINETMIEAIDKWENYYEK